MTKVTRNRLRVLRAEQHITQLTLARRSSVSTTRISFFENGLIEPTGRERQRLARALKVNEFDIFPL